MAAAIQFPVSPSFWRRWRDGLFGSFVNSGITLATLAFLGWAAPPILRWSLFDAVWTGNADSCHAAKGACWAFIGEKLRFILFGLYPPDQQWWALCAMLLLLALLLISAVPRFWSRGLIVAWVMAITATVALMAGVGHAKVPSDRWGGMPLTLLLSIVAVAGAFPIALVMALARRSRLGLFRLGAILFIEIVRGVPLIAVLYAATLLFPLMLPAGIAFDKLMMVQIAFTLFVAAFMAEIIRAGLQSVPSGQYEAAQSLGLSWWQSMRLAILPQALRVVIPSFVTLIIGVLQDSTLVAVIGIYDFLNAARVATSDPSWLGFSNEAFAFGALVYFAFCYIGSRYSLWLERRLDQGK